MNYKLRFQRVAPRRNMENIHKTKRVAIPLTAKGDTAAHFVDRPDQTWPLGNCCIISDFFMEFQDESGYFLIHCPDGLLKKISHPMRNVSPKPWLEDLRVRSPGTGGREDGYINS